MTRTRAQLRHARLIWTYAFTFCALLYAVVLASVLIAAPVIFERVGLSAAAVIWIPLRWLTVLAVTAIAFAMLYRFAPHRPPRPAALALGDLGLGVRGGGLAGRLAGVLGLL